MGFPAVAIFYYKPKAANSISHRTLMFLSCTEPIVAQYLDGPAFSDFAACPSHQHHIAPIFISGRMRIVARPPGNADR
jgi:hypothetical protein